MKKKIGVIICLVLLAVTVVTAFSACDDAGASGKKITVRFVTGFDDLVIDAVVLTADERQPFPDDPIKVGYDFCGWYYDEEFQRKFALTDALTEDTTLYAKFEKKTVDFPDKPDEKPEIDEKTGFTFKLSEDETYYSVVSYNGNEKQVVIPAVFNGKAVKRIARETFGTNDLINSINISSKAEDIEPGLFAGCSELNTISVTAGNAKYTSHGGVLYAKGSRKIVAVGRKNVESGNAFVVDEETVSIAEYAFAGCDFKVELPKNPSFNVLTERCFAKYDGEVTLGKNIEEIRKQAFYEATCKVVFDAECALSELTNGAFDGYKGEKLVFVSALNSVSECAFNDCTAELDFSACGLKSLGDRALYGYTGKAFVVPFSVKTIGSGCFYGSSATVTFEQNSIYEEVGENAFMGFKGEVVFPETVKSVRDYAFYACESGAKIRFLALKEQIALSPKAMDGSGKATVTYGK